ncbi:MAG: AsmA-like C-terminal domain-containing protein [Alphaproteobacteria bacterium]|nr:AsmA-like C-terminal domain-containing protein [Alphaproteobacteria bacterium]
MKKVSPQIYFLRRILHYFGIGLLIVLLLFLWSLYRGPIAVPYLKPYIIQALNYDENDYKIDIGDVNIELVRSIQPLRVTAKNISLEKKDNTFTVTAPKLYLSFSLRALLKGIIAPSDVNLKNPTVNIYASYGVAEEQVNEINKKKIEFYVEKLRDFLNRYNSAEKIYPESFVNNITINDAEVEFHEIELDRYWLLSDLDFEFNRHFINMKVNSNALVNINDKIASVGFEGEYHANADKMNIEFYFSDLVLADLIGTFNETTEDNVFSTMSIQVPVNGKISTEIDLSEVLQNAQEAADNLSGAIEKVVFELDGGQGYIAFNGEEKYNYAVDEVALSGQISGGIDEVEVKNAEFIMDGQQAIIDFYASGFATYFLENSLKNVNMRLSANVEKFPLEKLSVFWPRYMAEPAWQWCKDGLVGGIAQNAKFVFNFGYDEKNVNWGLKNLEGTAELADADLYYLDGMPLVNDIYGTAHFSDNNILINIDKGVSNGVIITGGKVDIYDLDKEQNYISINVIGNSKVADALRLINNKPLQITSEMGLNPNDIEGDIDINLKLDFELKQDLESKDIKVGVSAQMHNILSKKLLANYTLSAKEANLQVNTKGWSLAADADVSNIPVHINMNENFADKDYKSKCKVSFKLDDAAKNALGINWSVLQAPNMEGYADITADVVVNKNDLIDVAVKADLQHTKLDYAYLGFVKEASQPAEANVKLQLKKDKVLSVPQFSLIKQAFVMSGNISMYDSGRVKTVDISKISGHKTSARAKINLTDAALPRIKIDVSGTSYNLTPLFDKSEKNNNEKAKESGLVNEDDGLEELNDADIFMSVNSLWTNDTTPIQNFAGNVKLRHGIGIDEVHIVGNYGVDKSIKLNLNYAPRGNKEHFLTVDSNNAGSTLKVLRLYENMVGGTLKIEARRNMDKKFIGHATVRDFSIRNAPVVARLLSVASFTGMLDLLTGEGLTFTHFHAPFEYQYKTLKLKHAKAEGNVVGITTIGTYNRDTDNINMHGVMAPAYSLNRLLGKIPVVGNLLSGKDGTIFAADYKIDGSVDDPQVDINSLSILSPNSMKEWYNQNFGEGDDF